MKPVLGKKKLASSKHPHVFGAGAGGSRRHIFRLKIRGVIKKNKSFYRGQNYDPCACVCLNVSFVILGEDEHGERLTDPHSRRHLLRVRELAHL